MSITCHLCGHVNSANRIYCYECSAKISWIGGKYARIFQH